ncbi:MAG: DUF6624 domain-containing protein [Planctomycetota bacterium]
MRIATVLVTTLWLASCAGPEARAPQDAAPDVAKKPELPEVAAELLELAADDQRYERFVIRADPVVREPGFFDEKRRRMVERAERCKEIFVEFGFPGYDSVGEEASNAFWLLVQHADHDPSFQEEVLGAMKTAHRAGQADGPSLAYLTDRVRINTGRRQVYGTQVDFDHGTARAFPKPLEDPGSVDTRRALVGLKPLWNYMNNASETFFIMNESELLSRGVTGPFRYEEGFDQW